MDFEQDYQQTENIAVEDLDDALVAVRTAEEKYDEIHALSSEAFKALENAKGRLIDLMSKAGKKRWEKSGMKGFSLKESLKYRVPKDLEDKKAFFEFLKSEQVSSLLAQSSEDIFYSYATIHALSFNTLAKKIVEEGAEKGYSIELPGVEAPTTELTLISLRK